MRAAPSSIHGSSITAAVVIDGWVRLPVVPAPRPLPVTVTADLVVELPTWGYVEDVAAMYRGMSHGRPVVNGYSGFVPQPYAMVQADLKKGCVNSLEALRGGRSMDAVIWAARPASPRSTPPCGGCGRRHHARKPTTSLSIASRARRRKPIRRNLVAGRSNDRPNDRRLSLPIEFEPVRAKQLATGSR